jgi:hypothetical protein
MTKHGYRPTTVDGGVTELGRFYVLSDVIDAMKADITSIEGKIERVLTFHGDINGNVGDFANSGAVIHKGGYGISYHWGTVTAKY